ncbi:MAG: hypothetical protein HC836_39625 [Richelia sp. RM2_1_2]|nr:hypothetical protein [Richelia sp. RM1_1_1]NJO64076.1 hypothetical protein [Richelia sp. RM2_1_2]
MTDDMFKKLVKQRQKAESKTPAFLQSVEPTQSKDIPTAEPKKRGRPAKGKRSDPDWIGRTYYIRKQTDLDVEEELLRLKREGVELDKSELVDAMLDAWVKWRQGENIDLRIAEFSPRRNVDK